MSNQLTVRVASIGKPETLRGLLDVTVPLGLQNGDVLYYSSNTQNYRVDTLPFVDGANTLIQIRKSSVANASSLNNGELYYSFFDQKLYIGNTTNHLVPIAGNYYVDLANSIFYISNTAYNQANVARTHANAAFAVANTKFSANGGIIYGDVEISGNLSVLGNVTTFSANNIVIDDPFILLANNNGTDILDIGIAAHYDSNLHTGLFRSATTKEWYLFKGYDEHFFYTDGGNINLFANNFALDILNSDIRTSNLILGDINAISWIQTTYDQANVSRTHANIAFDQANVSRVHANASFEQANVARTHANSAFNRANTVYDVANTKLNISGGTIAGDLVVTGNITISGQTTYANTIQLQVGDNIIVLNADLPPAFAPSESAGIEVNRGSSTNVGLIWNEGTDKWTFTNDGTTYLNIASNTEIETNQTIAQGAFTQANTARTHANTAHATANAAYDTANTKLNISGGTITGNLIVSGQTTSPIQTLSDAANISWNCNSSAKAKVTITANRTMSAVTNAVEGTTYTLWVIQDSVGGRLLSWTTSGNGSFDFGADTAPTLSFTPNTADILAFEAITIAGTLKLRFLGIKRGFT